VTTDAANETPSPDREGHKDYEYFVDGKLYKSRDSALTGAQIKAKIPEYNPSYQLVQEGQAGHPDKIISDSDTVDLNVHTPLQFYTVPPATFG
jgi:hypothetical protein